MAQACLDASVRYTSERRQFGVPLKDHQNWSALLATGGGLLFNGKHTGEFYAMSEAETATRSPRSSLRAINQTPARPATNTPVNIANHDGTWK